MELFFIHRKKWFQAETQRTIFLWSVGYSGNWAQNGCFHWEETTHKKKKKEEERNETLILQCDEPWKLCGDWKKPDTKDYLGYDYIYMKCRE